MSEQGQFIEIIFKSQETYAEEFANFIEEYFEVISCNFTEAGLEQYIIYETTHFDEEAFISAADSYGVVLPEYKIEVKENKNWLTENVIKFAPVETEDFLVYGVHESSEPKTNKIPIKIYAATAFGSEHQTTKGCLDSLAYIRDKNIKKILDMGCGSGILSIGAAKLWKSADIYAVDIDDEAVRVTSQNVEDNNVSTQIKVHQSNGYDSDFVRSNAPFDLIVANILARPLIDMSESLNHSLVDGGMCILSGFVDNQLDWVVDAHIALGLKLIKIFSYDNWRAVLMEK